LMVPVLVLSALICFVIAQVLQRCAKLHQSIIVAKITSCLGGDHGGWTARVR
jgi:hypothetical protein